MTVTDERPSPSAPALSVTSLPARVRELAAADPDKVALREKVYGVWEETTYAGYWEMIQVVGAGLIELGVTEGDRVAVHSENRKAWVWAALGAHAIGAVAVGVYPTNPASDVRYILEHSETLVLFAEDQEQVDKALSVREQLPNLRRIVYVEPRGVSLYDDPLLLSWDDFVAMGKARLEREPDLVDRIVDGIDSETVASLVYTSGTTGPPKGAMISHRNYVWVMEHAHNAFGNEDAPDRSEILSYLPLCHIAEQLYTLLVALDVASTVNFAESIETVTQDLQEVQPTYFLGVPRIWEKMQAGVVIRMANASLLKQLIYKAGMSVGMRNADRLLATGKRGLWGDIQHAVFSVLLYRSLKEKLGMRHIASAISGAAPIAPEVLKFFMAIGVPIYEGYGQTENTAWATVNRMGAIKLGTVGVANVGTDVKLADDGEILIRHPGVFVGYYKDPEATVATLDDGWLHTGDVGEWDGDHVRIVDRKKDIIITSGGKNLSPSEIENKLKVSPFVKEALVIGDRRKFVSALIGIELDTVSNWALRRNIPFTTYRDLSEKPEVVELIQNIVTETNEELPSVAQIKQFRLIPKELVHEDGELTATQKVKRAKVETKFEDLIADIYGAA